MIVKFIYSNCLQHQFLKIDFEVSLRQEWTTQANPARRMQAFFQFRICLLWICCVFYYGMQIYILSGFLMDFVFLFFIVSQMWVGDGRGGKQTSGLPPPPALGQRALPLVCGVDSGRENPILCPCEKHSQYVSKQLQHCHCVEIC